MNRNTFINSTVQVNEIRAGYLQGPAFFSVMKFFFYNKLKQKRCLTYKEELFDTIRFNQIIAQSVGHCSYSDRKSGLGRI